MMGPEAMGVANANLVWSDDKVCRNFLCGTCPHALFTNTVCTSVYLIPFKTDMFFFARKWISVHVPNPTQSASRPSTLPQRKPTPTILSSIVSRWNTNQTSSRLWMSVIGEFALRTAGWRRRQRRTRRRRTWCVSFCYVDEQNFNLSSLSPGR